MRKVCLGRHTRTALTARRFWPRPAGMLPVQMKKRYSSSKPYGEWLAQELVTLEQIVRSVPESGEHDEHSPRLPTMVCCAAGLALLCAERS